MYSYDEAYEASLQYFNGDSLPTSVVVDKYLLKDNNGNFLEKSPDDMHRRLAREFARIEKNKFKEPLSEDFIYECFKDFQYIIPQGSPLYGVGNNFQTISLSNCYVSSCPVDSYGSILNTDEELVQISKRRGGVGIDISNLRPEGAPTHNSSRTSSGIVAWMKRYSNSIREVGQAARRGALMLTLSVHHPQILDFCHAKDDETQVTGANISVRLTNEFMQAVIDGKEYEQRFPLKDPILKKSIQASQVWQEIVSCARNRAEPGILFWDNIIDESPADCYARHGFQTVSTNPCLRGNTKVLIIDSGVERWEEISKLAGGDHQVKTVNDIWHIARCKRTGEQKQLWRIELNNGKEIYCTADHKWIVLVNMVSAVANNSIIQTVKTNELNIDMHSLIPIDWNQSPITIKSIAPTEIYEDVYCLTVYDNTKTFVIEDGIISCNCSELPLCEHDSCRLMCLNLFSFVEYPFTEKAYFNYSKFYKYAEITQRLMDDLVDLELEKINQIINKIEADPEDDSIKQRELDLWYEIRMKCVDGRRTGTGITALGDTLAALNIKYDSDVGINTVQYIYKVLKFGCYQSSVDMAKELGPFPIWNSELEKDCAFLNRFKEEAINIDNDPDCPYPINGYQIWSSMQQYGRRNIALLTTAPTGSISILCGPRPYFGTTSGIEPIFSDESYTRRKKINPGDKNARVDYIDKNGDKWQHFKVYHSKLKQWMDVTGETDYTKSPYHDSCAEKLDWKQRVKLQAAATKHIDHAISSTLNLPEDVTVDKVKEIYETAWKSGCKGITIYRANCRDGVLINNEKKTKITRTNAPKRPTELSCQIHHAKIKDQSYIVVIGLLENDPYELFAVQSELATKHTQGTLKKIKRGHYSLLSPDGKVDLLNNTSIDGLLNSEQEAITRMISTALRHGTDITFIVQQLNKIKGDMSGFAKCIGRVLKKYVPDGTKLSGEACQECGGNLIIQENCSRCQVCGWSKC